LPFDGSREDFDGGGSELWQDSKIPIADDDILSSEGFLADFDVDENGCDKRGEVGQDLPGTFGKILARGRADGHQTGTLAAIAPAESSCSAPKKGPRILLDIREYSRREQGWRTIQTFVRIQECFDARLERAVDKSESLIGV